MLNAYPRCRIVPQPNHEVSFEVSGTERLRWHFGPQYPRPFFYPLIGPSGNTLTRMGHPGAANHDHHRSIWFAHNKVLGIDFWSDAAGSSIRQREWLAYHDSDQEAVMAADLDWFDGHNPAPLLTQRLVAAIQPGPDAEITLELQSTFVPKSESLEFQKTNFGFLAVRVARSLSEHFGGGRLTNSEQRQTEQATFGQPARWMDYSGPVDAAGTIEGITYFDHPDNPGYPNRWHVREDGWMGASICMTSPQMTQRQRPLSLRFQLHAHTGDLKPDRAEAIAEKFRESSGFAVTRSSRKHQQWTVSRIA